MSSSILHGVPRCEGRRRFLVCILVIVIRSGLWASSSLAMTEAWLQGEACPDMISSLPTPVCGNAGDEMASLAYVPATDYQ